MRSKLFLMLVVLLVCLSAGQAQTINENESVMALKDKSAEISLAVESGGKTTATSIDLELLDAESKVRASVSQSFGLRKGKNICKIIMPLGDLIKDDEDGIYWFRLQYRIDGRQGVISLSELLKDIFELRASVPKNFSTGTTYRVRVRALNPFSLKAVKGVQVDGEFSVDIETDSDEDELKLTANGQTDGKGFVVLDFKIPPGIKVDREGDLDITGKKNGITREIDEDPEVPENRGGAFLTADKPLYQPGQNFHVRGIFLDQNYNVLPGFEIEYQIEDEDETVLYREKVKTSEYGVASASWKIPENAKLGAYVVKVMYDGDEMEDSWLYFKVTRYDLPNFTVAAKADRPYYLPSERNAAVTVSADYLFGKPVKRGQVRVVEENERRWSWREQKYESREGRIFEGETDAEGKYLANIDLGKEIDTLNERNWERFKDLSFAAYFTDLDTNRTEQKRFDIRITKEAIHIYFVRHPDINPKLPFKAYFSTFYADGSPAVCDVTVTGEGKKALTTRSNSLGAGKIALDLPDDPDDQYYDLRVAATDKNGLTGTYQDDIYLNEEDAVKFETDRTVYLPGDNIQLNLASTLKRGLVYIDVVKDWLVIGSYSVNLRNGKADLRIPYDKNFKGDLTIAAYTDDIEHYDEPKMRFSRGIIFPEQQNLRLDAKFSEDTYRPGEEARLKFSIFDGNGRAAQSALGIVVFDKAVEERARTETEFGGYFSRFYGMLGYNKGFGNITLKDLNDLDLSKPVTDEMQLAAEVMLAANYYYPEISRSSSDRLEARTIYAEHFKKQFTPVENILKSEFEKTSRFPADEAGLRKILGENGIDPDKLKDPWDKNYTPVFSIDKSRVILAFRTAGADKTQMTEDDFDVSSIGFAYFTPAGRKIDAAIADYHKETGGFVQDLATLSTALKKHGVDLEGLKDRWNRDYRITFEIARRHLAIKFRSLGEDGIYQTDWNSDDFDIWTNYTDYFAETELNLINALASGVKKNKNEAPRDESEFRRMLGENGIDLAGVRDAYNESVYLVRERRSRYVDKTVVENGKQKITPVTQELMTFRIRSKGEDRIVSGDDFDLATFSTEVLVAFTDLSVSTGTAKNVLYSGAKGAIRGTVTDPNGAVVPGAEVTAASEDDKAISFSTRTDESGVFLIQNIPSGKFTVTVTSPGFQTYRYDNVQVRSMNLVELNVVLSVAGTSASVEVTAAAEIDQSSNSSTSITTTTKAGQGRIAVPPEQTSTPRVREYFPETLFWNPELVTDKKGRAELKFKLADNITTWKMYSIASTKGGKIGVAEKEITAFQPFFVDLDPPKFLTKGDEISLPIQVRNYTEKKQNVNVTMTKADWFSFIGQDKQQVDVDKGSSANAIFGFKAIEALQKGKQRVTALAQGESDAIEKPVTVRPDGEEIVRTESRVFKGTTGFEVNFPANALPKTQKAELKIYPNLFSHVAESVEGLLQRPYGCGEQTISSTYPNLMILKFTKQDNKLRSTAEIYLQKGYERLTGYQGADGGFTYWGGKETSDLALTAYALRFLKDADEFIDVDPKVMARAQEWLIKQQRPDGSWVKKYYYETTEDRNRTKLFTSYVARTLARLKITEGDALKKALDYLKARNAEIDEPYSLALYGLALLDAGNKELAAEIAAALEKMAIEEGSAVYWKLETNTPFYGWGTAGRLETTALVTQFLIREGRERNAHDPTRDSLISRGTLFLIRNKDRYGVWFSTQTTINVLDTFLAALGPDGAAGAGPAEGIQVSINGAGPQILTPPADGITPLIIDLTGQLGPLSNRVEIKGTNGSTLMAQVVAGHYIDWKDSESTNTTVNHSRALKMDYRCDKVNTAIMKDVTCSVEAERVGFKGYGMLLAELGTPPGANVSRESLEEAMASDGSISRYDILPDRIVIYMWAKAGGTKFNFKFKPRYGINAQTPASCVYDYYNPEARAVGTPIRFVVR